MPPKTSETTPRVRRIRPDADDVSRRIIAPPPAVSAPGIAPDIPEPIDPGPFPGRASDPPGEAPHHVVLVLSRERATLHEGTAGELSPVQGTRFPVPLTGPNPAPAAAPAPRREARRPGTLADVDRALAAYLAERPAPVVVAGPQALVAAFRDESTEVRALAGAVYGAFDDLSADEVRRRVRPVLRRYIAWRAHVEHADRDRALLPPG